MKKIIEKIRERGYDTQENDYEPEAVSFNDGLEAAIGVIKVEFAEKDAPDSDGWWFAMRGDTIVACCFIEVEHNGDFYVPVSVSVDDVLDGSITWIKAIVPTKDGE